MTAVPPADIFRAYDVRGVVGDTLTDAAAEQIGRAFATQARAAGHSTITVGGDGRHSTPMLREALTHGLIESGCHVIDVGMVPTPLLYFAAHTLGTGTGVMITGSHNAPEYNGFKMVIGDRALAGQAVKTLHTRIKRRDFAAGPRGDAVSADIVTPYIERVVADIKVARRLTVAIDCGNGAGGVVAPRLYDQLGCEVLELYTEVDGDFPNHHPDPAEPDNLRDLIRQVECAGADVGLAFDGDADRLGVVTNRGHWVSPDRYMMLFADDVLKSQPGAAIVYDVKCSRHLANVIKQRDGQAILCRTGHSYIKERVREIGAALGGEFSGHICFNERWLGFDDALYAGARLLEIAAASEADVDTLFAHYPNSHATPEIKLESSETDKFAIVERLATHGAFDGGEVTAIDGVRVDYADGFGLARASNTSPMLSLRFEADTPAALDRIQAHFRDQLAAVAPQLELP